MRYRSHSKSFPKYLDRVILEIMLLNHFFKLSEYHVFFDVLNVKTVQLAP